MRAYTECMELGTIHFIGGGNMASASIGGLVHAGHRASAIRVVDPQAQQRARLAAR